jgi:CBS domain-containing protein
MTVRDLMREDVVTATPGTAVTEVAERARAENVGSVVVVDGDEPVGIVTDRDIALRVVADGADPTSTTASDVMTADPTTVDIEAGVMELSREMCGAGVRRMPVVDGGELVGIVTLDDLDRLLVGELGNLAGVVAGESPPY